MLIEKERRENDSNVDQISLCQMDPLNWALGIVVLHDGHFFLLSLTSVIQRIGWEVSGGVSTLSRVANIIGMSPKGSSHVTQGILRSVASPISWRRRIPFESRHWTGTSTLTSCLTSARMRHFESVQLRLLKNLKSTRKKLRWTISNMAFFFCSRREKLGYFVGSLDSKKTLNFWSWGEPFGRHWWMSASPSTHPPTRA